MSSTTPPTAREANKPAASQLPKRKKPLSWYYYVAIFVLVAVLLTGGLYTVWYYSARSKLEAQISAARKRGEPVWFSDLRPQPVDPSQDGGPLYLEAARRLSKSSNLQGFEDAIGRARQAVQSGDGQGGIAFNEPLLAQTLMENAEALVLLRQTLDRPYHRFPIDWDIRVPLTINLEHTQKVRQFSHLLGAEFLLALKDGDIDAAVAAIDHNFRLSEVLREEPFLISQLVRIAIAGRGLSDLELLLGHRALTPEQFALLDGRLKQLEANFRLQKIALAERAAVLTNMENIREATGMGTDQIGGLYGNFLTRPLLMEEQAFTMRIFGAMAEAADQTGPEGRTVQRDVIDSSALPRRYHLTRLMLPAVDAMCQAGLRHRQALLNARVALRVSRQHGATGQFPATLQEVLDADLTQLPVCLYSHQPLVYKLRPQGFSIYCQGDNGVDDGGGQQPDMQEAHSAFDVQFPSRSAQP